MANAGHANLIPAKPGEVRNPNGRTDHNKRTAGEKCWKALRDDFEVNGVQAIIDFRTNNPGAYVQLAASGLPAESKVIHERAESLTEEQARMMAEEYVDRAQRGIAASPPEPIGVHDSLQAGLQTSERTPQDS